MIDALLKPFYQFLFNPPQQGHPALVHFPIACLFVEAVLLGLWRRTGKPEYERTAYGFLHASLWTMLLAAGAGVHDVGLDAGQGNRFWLGLQDRWAHAFQWQSLLTVHVWLMQGLIVLTALRLLWRKLGGPGVLHGASGWGYALLTLCSLWTVSAAGYIAGLLSHK